MTEVGELQVSVAVDGRSRRWQSHRIQRRHEIVEATLRAIRKYGASVGMDEIANQARTSKTVIYRHFGDRAGLWSAVVESVHAYILSNLEVPLSLERLDPAALVTGLSDAYLSLVERDVEIYHFVLNRPGGSSGTSDPVSSITSGIGVLVADALREHLRAAGRDDSPADVWGHGVVGMVWAVADAWLASGLTRPRAEVVGDLAALMTPAFASLVPPLHSSKELS